MPSDCVAWGWDSAELISKYLSAAWCCPVFRSNKIKPEHWIFRAEFSWISVHYFGFPFLSEQLVVVDLTVFVFFVLFFSWYLKVKTLKWVARWQLTKNQNSSCLSWSSRQTNSSWFKRNKHWWTDGAHRWQMKLQGWAVCWKHLNLGYFRSLVKTLPTLFCDRLNVSCSADDSVDLHVYINWLRRWRPVDESLQGRAGYIIYIHTVCTQLSWKH